jgi:hypothetical protein
MNYDDDAKDAQTITMEEKKKNKFKSIKRRKKIHI